MKPLSSWKDIKVIGVAILIVTGLPTTSDTCPVFCAGPVSEDCFKGAISLSGSGV